ncbi:MAG: SOS response-associated peptidase [Desulfomonilaceae bacterium]
MCGRFILISSQKELTEEYGLIETPEVHPRYNIAPSQEIAAIRYTPGTPNNRELIFLQWGLTPLWSKDPFKSSGLINARSETIDSKPVFKSCLKKQRVLIPSNGFYEWSKSATGFKQAYLIHFRNHRLLSFAGIYDEHKSPSGDIVRTCAIITTESNDDLKTIHDRMPVIINRKDYALWLESENINRKEFRGMLRPYNLSGLEILQVGAKVNKPGYDAPDCMEPLGEICGKAELCGQQSLFSSR